MAYFINKLPLCYMHIKGIYKNIWKKYHKFIIIFFVFIILVIIGVKIAPQIDAFRLRSSKIIEIAAENSHLYSQNENISERHFTIEAIYDTGQKRELDPGLVSISTTQPAKTGPITKVTLTLKDDPNVSCEVNVQNKRDKLVSVDCGHPDIENVQAVLYSNGELCFEGKGNILEYNNGDYPWLNFSNKTKIISVSFEEGVAPLSLDNYFKNLETLEYIESIPSSVESMSATCKGCISLKSAPDVSKCSKLSNMIETYADCASLTYIPPVPKSVKNTTLMCDNCPELQIAPDLSQATGLVISESMYNECYKLIEANIAPNAEIINNMFDSCINMKQMPKIPESVVEMDSAFRNNTSLMYLTEIPKNVQSISNCFSGCGKIQGKLIVNGNPSQYSSFLSGAAVTTSLDLQGDSKLLDLLALTCDGVNVTVKGKAPDKNAKYSELIEK